MNYYIATKPLGWLQESILVTLNPHLLSIIFFQWFVMLTLVCVPLVIVTLEPCERSETYVNGKRVAQPVQLRSGETGRGLKSSEHMACASNSLIFNSLSKG